MDILTLAAIAVALSLLMTAAWAAQRLTGHSGWVDVTWSLAVGSCGVLAALLPSSGAIDARRFVVGGLIALWALRLGWHIAKRTHGGEDDPRYAALIRQWGKDAGWQLFLFLQIQALAAFVLVVAVRWAAINPAPFASLSDYAGIALLLVAVGGEGIADAQLAQFGKAHKKAVCDTGLWRWSRHPNYFFEWLGWCAWAALAVTPAEPWSLTALAAPMLMYALLVHVSGIPPLEAHMLASRGEAFKAYQSRVSAFFPLPPKPEPRKPEPAA